MKKITTITLSVIAGSVLAYNANALTCGAQPSCSDLGYTITSTSNCVGTVLKCPFDKTKYFCTQKSDIFYQFKLNWGAYGNISGKANWTAYQNGIIIGHGEDVKNYGSWITINGKRIGSLTRDVGLSLIHI